ncbi:MAG: TIGR00282 family metallophosphoesterase [Candidatus Rifleibacteriota bacterium]
MKILIIGDIYGKTGRDALAEFMPALQKKYQPDWIIANGENVTAGNGLSARHAKFLKEQGIDVITTGNHLFSRLDWPELLTKEEAVLRPHNIGPTDASGSGCRVFKKANGMSLGVINLAGRVFMEKARCPFRSADLLLSSIGEGFPVIIDFHAEATSEKQALFWHLDGRVSAIVGTHTHVQTSDERILPGGTAVISDLGMTGSRDGVLGVDRETIIGRFLNGYSDKFLCSAGARKIEGVCITLGLDWRAENMERFRLESQ